MPQASLNDAASMIALFGGTAAVICATARFVRHSRYRVLFTALPGLAMSAWVIYCSETNIPTTMSWIRPWFVAMGVAPVLVETLIACVAGRTQNPIAKMFLPATFAGFIFSAVIMQALPMQRVLLAAHPEVAAESSPTSRPDANESETRPK